MAPFVKLMHIVVLFATDALLQERTTAGDAQRFARGIQHHQYPRQNGVV